MVVALLVLGGVLWTAPSYTRDTAEELFRSEKPFPWRARVRLPSTLSFRPGQQLITDVTLDVDLRPHDAARYGRFTQLIVALTGELQYDDQGRYRTGRASGALSTNFTTAGIPVEYFDGWPRVGKLHGRHRAALEAVRSFELGAAAKLARRHRFQGELTVQLPAGLAAGWYRPQLLVFVRVQGVADPVHLTAFADNWNEAQHMVLPLIKVGDAATPRMPWTILSQVKYRGQAGTLSDEDRRTVGLVPRAGFHSLFIIPPGKYRVSPGLPTIFPKSNIPFIAGGDVVIPERLHNYLRLGQGSLSLKVQGPGGSSDLGSRRLRPTGDPAAQLGAGFAVDMTRTGRYALTLTGHVDEKYGRRFEGGGRYSVHVARPLSFSTSCKPGSSFLVGGAYPPKVNINPPFPAQVELLVDFFPNSDVARKIRWSAVGRANRFGHFAPHKKPLLFDQPGEYRSRVVARFTDGRGQLWMGEQSSTGVVAPQTPGVVRLHGTRSFPYGLRAGRRHNGGVKRFRGRPDMSTSFLPSSPTMLPDPYVPYDPRDTLFVATGGYHESLVEPHFSVAVSDAQLRGRLLKAHSVRSFLVPPMYQPVRGAWLFLKDVVQLSTDSGGWFPTSRAGPRSPATTDELPVLPVNAAGLHPFAQPAKNSVEAYTIMGVFRPGFPVMTAVHQRDAIGLYWLTSPNRFAYHFNNGPNGDLPGDLYRVQGGVVIKDRVAGKNYYDAYSAAIAVTEPGLDATAIRAPGERPLVTVAGREHRLFLATDTHDSLEVGERLGLGGMVFPAVRAQVTWTVTSPGGQTVTLRARADRLGIARGGMVPVSEPGLYRVKVRVRHGKLTGDVVGTRDGSYFVCAVAPNAPQLLSTTLAGVTSVDPREGLRVPLTWPQKLTGARLHWGVLMPGQVLDQGHLRPRANRHEYPLEPLHLAHQFANLDVRNFTTGRWGLADTVVLQFFLEGSIGGARVFDSLRLVLRKDRLYNYRAMMKPARAGGAHAPGAGFHRPGGTGRGAGFHRPGGTGPGAGIHRPGGAGPGAPSAGQPATIHRPSSTRD